MKKPHIGTLQPIAARELYMGRIDPPRTSVLEVVIRTQAVIGELTNIQPDQICCMLGSNLRSVTTPLYTEVYTLSHTDVPRQRSAI